MKESYFQPATQSILKKKKKRRKKTLDLHLCNPSLLRFGQIFKAHTTLAHTGVPKFLSYDLPTIVMQENEPELCLQLASLVLAQDYEFIEVPHKKNCNLPALEEWAHIDATVGIVCIAQACSLLITNCCFQQLFLFEIHSCTRLSVVWHGFCEHFHLNFCKCQENYILEVLE